MHQTSNIKHEKIKFVYPFFLWRENYVYKNDTSEMIYCCMLKFWHLICANDAHNLGQFVVCYSSTSSLPQQDACFCSPDILGEGGIIAEKGKVILLATRKKFQRRRVEYINSMVLVVE